MAVAAFVKSKEAYLDNEAELNKIITNTELIEYYERWLNNCIHALDTQYEACETKLAELQQIVAVEKGDYWNNKTLVAHCNLLMDERRLFNKDNRRGEHNSLAEVVRLITVLAGLKKGSFVSPKQVKFIEQVERELKQVAFDPSDIRCICHALYVKLGGDLESQNTVADISRQQQAIEELQPDLESCEQLLDAAMLNGDMALAEDIANNQVSMYERLLELTTDQYPHIRVHEERWTDFFRRRRWAIFRNANKDITSVVERKLRQIEACEEDITRIQHQVERYSADDLQQRKRYDMDKAQSDLYLSQGKEKQQAVWNRINDLFAELTECHDELGQLSSQRQKEVERRLRMEEREAGRRNGHENFLKVSEDYVYKLQETIQNAMAAKDVAQALNDFSLDGCTNVTLKFDRRESALKEMLQTLHRQHFQRFTDYYLCVGRLLYKKEKRISQLDDSIKQQHIQLEIASETLDVTAKKHAEKKVGLLKQRAAVENERAMLMQRRKLQEERIAPVLRAFDVDSIPYVHPEKILQKVSVDREEKVLSFRDILNPSLTKEERSYREELLALEQKTKEVVTAQAHTSRRPKPPGLTGNAAPVSHAAYKRRVSTDTDSNSAMKKAQPPELPSTTQQLEDRFQHLLASTASRNNRFKAEQSEAEPTTTGRLQAATVAVKPNQLEGSTLLALFSYTARAGDELSFTKGDNIVCISLGDEEGWLYGACNQKTGLFPANYVAPT